MKDTQEWLDSLQIGDKVAMNIGSYVNSSYSVATITKITPKRRLSTSNGMTFNADGSEYGKGGTWSRSTDLEPVTQDILEQVERNHLIESLRNEKFEELSLETLRSIQAILGIK